MPQILVATATVLVVERRRCRCCGMVFDAPSPNLHEFVRSPVGQPYAQAIQRIPNGDYIVAERQTMYVKEIEIPACYMCWREDVPMAAVLAEPHPPMPKIAKEASDITVRGYPRLEDL